MSPHATIAMSDGDKTFPQLPLMMSGELASGHPSASFDSSLRSLLRMCGIVRVLRLLSFLLSPVSFLLFSIAPLLPAQTPCPELPFVRGLRVYGGNDETALPVMSKNGGRDIPGFITIRFDVATRQPPRLKIRFRHCNKDWEPDKDFFVRDEFFTYSRYLAYTQAPSGAAEYTWRFTNAFPSRDNPFVRFLYSGNWVFEISDENSDANFYGGGRFIVVENAVKTRFNVFNDYWTENDMPLDRVHRLELQVAVPDTLFADFVKTVDFYKNHRLFESYRADSYAYQNNARVEGIGQLQKTFTYMNVLPGNGYRFFDFRNVGTFANNRTVERLDGADLTRWRFGTDPMHFYGSSRTSSPASWDDDYLCVLFALNHPDPVGRQIFIAGDFNEWDPLPGDRLVKNPKTNHYEITYRLLRGAYEYQYVTGVIDEEKNVVVSQDWTELEGNAWDVQNLYWAVVYYDDDQFGGVTRAVGFATRVAGR